MRVREYSCDSRVRAVALGRRRASRTGAHRGAFLNGAKAPKA